MIDILKKFGYGLWIVTAASSVVILSIVTVICFQAVDSLNGWGSVGMGALGICLAILTLMLTGALGTILFERNEAVQLLKDDQKRNTYED